MTGAGVRRKPTFLWQAVLILLPVAVLSALGWSMVRQDKHVARQEAVQRAQAIAQELLPKIWTELTSTDQPGLFQRHSFQTDDAGQLIFPPAYSLLPIPDPFDLKELTSEQARLWRTIQSAGSPGPQTEMLIQATRDFIALKPPEHFAAAAEYDLGLLLMRQGKGLEAAEMFDSILDKYPDAVGESGLPLHPLAQFKLSELIEPLLDRPHSAPTSPKNGMELPDISLATLKHVVSRELFCSNIVCHPTALTPFFLNGLSQRADEHTVEREAVSAQLMNVALSNRSAYFATPLLSRKQWDDELAAIRKWQGIWEQQETSRQLFSTARPLFHARSGLPVPRIFALLDETRANPEDQQLQFGPALAEAESNASNAIAPRLLWFNTPMPLDGSFGDTSSNAVIEGKTYRAFSGDVPDWKWLAVRFDENQTSHWFVCHSESELGARLGQIAKDTKAVPEYLGVGLEVAGRKLYAYAPDLRVWSWGRQGGKEGSTFKVFHGSPPEILSAVSRLDGGVETLKVSVYLTSPATLYQHQVARAFWFGALVLVSTMAALTGLFAAWRAFKRQEVLVEMKSNFVSSVSHELRAPIASVRLMAESLERGKIPDAPRQHEYFRFIVQECRRLSSLIENVLDFSRIEQGRKQYEFEPTDLAALTRETVRLMEPYAAEKGVALKLETSNIEHRTSNIELEVDGRAIQQALVNLIDNAIKHSPKGETVTVGLEVPGVRCQVSGEPPPSASPPDLIPDTPHLTLFVSDHGPGIPPEEHEKIFERFYRLGSELRRETQGVGIGLSIVQHIVEAHGGRVRVESDVGKGSRFVIELPLKR
jgi:signal transduction histidine kinase